MDNELLKEALSYSLAPNLHEEERKTKLREDGTYESNIEKTIDEDWILEHGTDEVDIENCTFDELPKDWQKENLLAARLAIDLVFDKAIEGQPIFDDELEEMSSTIHDEWMKRNHPVNEKENEEPKLTVPYKDLPQEEKAKDKIQLVQAITKIQDYKDGLVDIDEICQKYNLSQEQKSF